jgi:hypothetical protein
VDGLTLAALFTAGGAVAAAALVRQLIQVLKAAFPMLDARVSGAALAFVLAAVLYVLAFAACGPFNAEGVFAAFLAWLGCAVGAIGINATVSHVDEVTRPTLP